MYLSNATDFFLIEKTTTTSNMFLKKIFQRPQLSVIYFNENCFRNFPPPSPVCPILLNFYEKLRRQQHEMFNCITLS